MACKELSVNLAVLAPNNNQQLSFGLTRGCNPDDTPFFIIDFVFRDRKTSNDDFQDRVKLHVTIGIEDAKAAQNLMTQGLTNTDIAFLSGPVTNRAKKLPQGTTSDPKLSNMVTTLVDQHA